MEKKLYFSLFWNLTFKYQPNGSVFFDNIMNNNIFISVNTDFLNLKFIETINLFEYEICKKQLEESIQFSNFNFLYNL